MHPPQLLASSQEMMNKFWWFYKSLEHSQAGYEMEIFPTRRSVNAFFQCPDLLEGGNENKAEAEAQQTVEHIPFHMQAADDCYHLESPL